jgi:hypothetical protein
MDTHPGKPRVYIQPAMPPLPHAMGRPIRWGTRHNNQEATQ